MCFYRRHTGPVSGAATTEMMRILLAIDGSNCSNAAVREVARRPWPDGSKLKVITVMEVTPIPALPTLEIDNYRNDLSQALEQAARDRARAIIDSAVAAIQEGEGRDLTITAKILNGSPKHLILDEAERWEATLIVVGAHDYQNAERTLFGSVSQTVALNAKCSVEIVRQPKREKKGGKK